MRSHLCWHDISAWWDESIVIYAICFYKVKYTVLPISHSAQVRRLTCVETKRWNKKHSKYDLTVYWHIATVECFKGILFSWVGCIYFESFFLDTSSGFGVMPSIRSTFRIQPLITLAKTSTLDIWVGQKQLSTSCSVKKVFLKILQKLQENTCARVSGTVDFLWILKSF